MFLLMADYVGCDSRLRWGNKIRVNSVVER